MVTDGVDNFNTTGTICIVGLESFGSGEIVACFIHVKSDTGDNFFNLRAWGMKGWR